MAKAQWSPVISHGTGAAGRLPKERRGRGVGQGPAGVGALHALGRGIGPEALGKDDRSVKAVVVLWRSISISISISVSISISISNYMIQYDIIYWYIKLIYINFIPNNYRYNITGWWLSHPVLKNMSSSIGMMNATQYFWENKNGNQTTNQYIYIYI